MCVVSSESENTCHNISIAIRSDYENAIVLSEWILYCLLTPIFIIVGLLGNACIIYVITKGRQISKSLPLAKKLPKAYTYMNLMAIFDFLSCIAAIPWPLLYYWGKKQVASFWKNRDFDSYVPYYQSYLYVSFLSVVEFPLKFTFSKTSDILIIVLSVDRYIAIRYPLRYHRLQGQMNVKYITTSILVLCLLLELPTTTWYETIPLHISNIILNCNKFNSTVITNSTADYLNGTTINSRVKSNFPTPKDNLLNLNRVKRFELISKSYRKDHAFFIYEIIREILLTYIPLVLLFILNINIIFIFTKYLKDKQGMILNTVNRFTSSEKSENINNRLKQPFNCKVRPIDNIDSIIGNSKDKALITNINDQILFDRLPSINLTTANSSTIIKSEHYSDRHLELSKKEKRLTYTMIILIMKYLIFTIPLATVDAIYMEFCCPDSYCLFRDIVTLANFLEIIKSSTNFFIYYTLDETFKRILKSLCHNL
ncbi:unnamed protein product [Gordionus sp. m RMFG-2023]